MLWSYNKADTILGGSYVYFIWVTVGLAMDVDAELYSLDVKDSLCK